MMRAPRPRLLSEAPDQVRGSGGPAGVRRPFPGDGGPCTFGTDAGYFDKEEGIGP